MTSLLVLPSPVCLPNRPSREADLIRARLASAERWRRRRRWLRLRAAIFGRAKLASGQRSGTPALRPATG